MNFLISIFLVGFLLCGCAQTLSDKPGDERPAAHNEKLETRANAASLLHDLLGDEKNVSKILIIKHNSVELGRLIRLISETAAKFQKQLEELAQADTNLNLHALGLPPGEKAARAAAAKTEEHELLASSGKQFEFNLLLTQAQALNYGAQLAKVAAEYSYLPDEAQKFTTMSQVMNNLCKQVTARMYQQE